MNSKMTINSQLSTTEPKTKTKQKSRTGTESQKWRSYGGLSVGSGWRENRGKGAGSKKHKWQVENRQGEVKNSIGNGEATEFICMTRGHELRWENAGGKGCSGQRGMKGRKKMG